MTRDISKGELVFDDKYTAVMVSLDHDQLNKVREWAESCGKSIPKLIKDLLLQEILYYERETCSENDTTAG